MSQTPSATSRYLDARLATASQPELHLMLLEGALRFGAQAKLLWNAADQRAECDCLLDRTGDVVEELVRSVVLGSSDQSKRLEEEYAFIFRQLARAHLSHDAVALEKALTLLAYERETWKLACDQLKSAGTRLDHPSVAPRPHTASVGQGLSLRG